MGVSDCRRAMTLEEEQSRYLEGIALFNARRFFEAHEVWEDVWNAACGIKHDFYQGLIQAAVALEHYRRSNPRGVVNLRRRFRRRLALVPDRFMGLDVRKFLQEMERTLSPLTSASALPEKGTIVLDPESAPTITLEYDPFSSGEAARYCGLG